MIYLSTFSKTLAYRSFYRPESQLETLSAPLGQIESVRLIRDASTGRSRGFGFVEMADDNQARAACYALDQREVDGRRLTVNEAKPQERRTGRYSNGGGGGRQGRQGRW